MLLADRAGLRNSGCLINAGTVNGTGSDTKRVRYAGLAGTDLMSTTAAENTDVNTTALTDASADIAVVRGSLRRDISDLASLTGFSGSDVDPFALAASMAISFERWFNSLVANVIDDFTTDVGASGVDASVDDLFDAIYILEIANVDSQVCAVLAARQWADLQESMRGETGAFQFLPATAEALGMKGQGYQGSILGVDIFKMSDVLTTGGNREGAVFGIGAVGYALGTPGPISGGSQVVTSDSPILVELQRDASAATTEVIASGYAGCAILEDAYGVGFVTDA